MKRTTGVLPGLLVFVGLMGAMTDIGAIENGQPDTRHHNVGAIGFYYDFDGPEGPAEPQGPFGLCSGFVISDWAFVTAAHCIVAIPGAHSWVVTLDGGSPESPALMPGVFTGANLFAFPILAEVDHALDVFVHPDFDAGTYENDVAVLAFDRGTFDIRGVRLPEAGYLDSLEESGTLELQPVGLVGYGAESLSAEGFIMPGFRQRGFCRASQVSANWLFPWAEFPFDASTMPGDSGSPQFMSGRAVALTSALGPFQRLDTDAVLEFLHLFLD